MACNRPARGMLLLVVQHHPHRPGVHLRRKLVGRLARHSPVLSGVGASGKPGAVKAAAGAPVQHPSRDPQHLACADPLKFSADQVSLGRPLVDGFKSVRDAAASSSATTPPSSSAPAATKWTERMTAGGGQYVSAQLRDLAFRFDATFSSAHPKFALAGTCHLHSRERHVTRNVWAQIN